MNEILKKGYKDKYRNNKFQYTKETEKELIVLHGIDIDEELLKILQDAELNNVLDRAIQEAIESDKMNTELESKN